LSCDYYETSGIRQKGCRVIALNMIAAGRSERLFVWYPIDKVKGDGLEEGAGYQGKTPVYYCAELVHIATALPETLLHQMCKQYLGPVRINIVRAELG